MISESVKMATKTHNTQSFLDAFATGNRLLSKLYHPG